ncbi:MAG TPA: putative manganese transporter, partial [Polyangia bacterium]|nr:putative manganese transporter [Polyangia bacterium]
MHELLNEFRQVVALGLMITGFVAVMMLAVEYVNVLTQGVWYRALSTGRWRQYLLAAALGAIPGCLGAFVVVSLYAHRRLSLGAVVTAMIATLGDETFVLLAMAPGTAAWLIPALALLGLPAGFLTDLAYRRSGDSGDCCELPLHAEQAAGACFARGRILAQWGAPSPHRAILTVVLALFALG